MYRVIVIDEENYIVEINNVVMDAYLVITDEQRRPTQYVLRSNPYSEIKGDTINEGEHHE